MSYRSIDFTKSFIKQFKLLRPAQKKQFYVRLALYEADPQAKVLNDHAIKGKYIGYRSMNVSGDLRALYRVDGDRIILFCFIGTHSQLYG